MRNKVPEGFETDDRLDVALRPKEVLFLLAGFSRAYFFRVCKSFIWIFNVFIFIFPCIISNNVHSLGELPK